MSRLLFLVVIFAVIYLLLKSYRKQMTRGDKAGGADGSEAVEDMVRCAECSVHLPKRESIMTGGKYFCSEAHRRANAGKPE